MSQENQDAFNEEPEIIFIPDEEGNEEEFEVIMKFDVEDSDVSYMMVVPLDTDDESDVDEVYAFRYEEDGDDLKLFTINDDDEWQMVEETFNTLLSEFDE